MIKEKIAQKMNTHPLQRDKLDWLLLVVLDAFSVCCLKVSAIRTARSCNLCFNTLSNGLFNMLFSVIYQHQRRKQKKRREADGKGAEKEKKETKKERQLLHEWIDQNPFEQWPSNQFQYGVRMKQILCLILFSTRAPFFLSVVWSVILHIVLSLCFCKKNLFWMSCVPIFRGICV